MHTLIDIRNDIQDDYKEIKLLPGVERPEWFNLLDDMDRVLTYQEKVEEALKKPNDKTEIDEMIKSFRTLGGDIDKIVDLMEVQENLLDDENSARHVRGRLFSKRYELGMQIAMDIMILRMDQEGFPFKDMDKLSVNSKFSKPDSITAPAHPSNSSTAIENRQAELLLVSDYLKKNEGTRKQKITVIRELWKTFGDIEREKNQLENTHGYLKGEAKGHIKELFDYIDVAVKKTKFQIDVYDTLETDQPIPKRISGLIKEFKSRGGSVQEIHDKIKQLENVQALINRGSRDPEIFAKRYEIGVDIAHIILLQGNDKFPQEHPDVYAMYKKR